MPLTPVFILAVVAGILAVLAIVPATREYPLLAVATLLLAIAVALP